MERDAWGAHYKRLLTAYGKEPDAAQFNLYFESLAGLDAEAVGRGVSETIAVDRFFPTVSELRKRCVTLAAEDADPLYPQYVAWQRGWGEDGAAITFAMFKHYVDRHRGAS